MSEFNEYPIVVALNSSRFGQGNPRLGESLMKDFLQSVSTEKNRPDAILLYNSAVVLACQDSELHAQLETLEKAGTAILANQESLEFYSLSERLVCGKSADMEQMSTVLMQAAKVIKP